MRFVTDGAQRSLTIDVPKPMSPYLASGLPDVRKLGIGIAEIAIGSTPPALPASAAAAADGGAVK